MKNPTIKLCTKLYNQLYKSFHGKVIDQLLEEVGSDANDKYLKSVMSGHSLKVSPALLPRVYDVLSQVLARLDYTKPIDLYISSDSEVNAFSIAPDSPSEPSIININSGLLKLMSDAELAFVIGHEVGHLINGDTKLRRTFNFLYPDGFKIPLLLTYKVRLQEQLAELVADRYGYIGCGEDLNSCISAFYKMSSGIDLLDMGVSIATLIEENQSNLRYFENEGISHETHPVNPIRIESVRLFSQVSNPSLLSRKTNDLIDILLKVNTEDDDIYVGQFVAAVSLIIQSMKHPSDKFDERVLLTLGAYTIFPHEFLSYTSTQNLSEVINSSITAALEIDPSKRDALLDYVIELSFADGELNKSCIKFIYDFGTSLGYCKKEISQFIADDMSQKFIPALNSYA